MKFGLIGDPLGHSFSPGLHAAYGRTDYELLPMPAEKLGEFFEKRDFIGINVTIPHKRNVMPYMDSLHSTASECGAVNTVVNNGGRLTGYNTDAYGMHFAILRYSPNSKGCSTPFSTPCAPCSPKRRRSWARRSAADCSC